MQVLLGGATEPWDLDVETSERFSTQTSENLSAPTPKSKDPDYQRTTVYLPKSLHRKLRAAAISDDRQMSDVIEEIVAQWLTQKEEDKHSDV
jgi:molybdopterin-guanine dinucleotide biosynthesis protein A